MTPTGYAEPSDPRTVYTLWAEDGTCLYVGCTVRLARRLKTHGRERPWWPEVARIETEVHPNEASGFAAETARIKQLDPVHNRVHTSHPAVREWTPERRAAHGEAVRRGKQMWKRLAVAPWPQVTITPDLTRHEVGRLAAAALARHADRKRAS